MKNSTTKKRVEKEFRYSVSKKLSQALWDYSNVMSEKEYQACIKKAAKTFTRDFSKAIENRILI